MGIAYNPRIVTNGLVLALDAANSKSYDSNENLVTYSDQFDNAVWTKGNSFVTTNTTATSAPDGTNTAEKLVESAINGLHSAYFSRNGSNETLTFSVFCKSAERTKVILMLANFSGETAQATYDLSVVTVTQNASNADYTNISSSIVPYPNGWYRCILTAKKGSVNAFNIPLISFRDASGVDVYVGDGSSGIYIWGAQLERGSSAGPYYPTTASAKNRGTTWTDLSGNGNNGTLANGPTYSSSNGGSIVFDGGTQYATASGNAGWGFGQNGAVEQWVYVNGNSGGNDRFWCVNNNSSSIDAYLNGSTYNIAFHGGVVLTATTIPQGSWVHFVVTYTSGTIKVYFNTIEQGLTGTTTGYNITNNGTLYIARYTSAPYELNGRIASMKIYNRALTAAEVRQNFNALRGRYGI